MASLQMSGRLSVRVLFPEQNLEAHGGISVRHQGSTLTVTLLPGAIDFRQDFGQEGPIS